MNNNDLTQNPPIMNKNDLSQDPAQDSEQDPAQDPAQEPSYPDQSISISLILIITAIYFVVKYNKDKENIIDFIIYGLALILSQLFINLNLTNTVCGTNQWLTTTFVTFIPWILIFGFLNLMIIKFPGWLKPFSNTFGYGIVYTGVNNVLNKILDSNTTSEFTKILNESSNKALIINEIPPSTEGFDEFYKTLLNPNATAAVADAALKEQLRKLIKLKNIIAEFIWFSLTGILTTLVSYHYIINSACL